jgi:hypothetical protein
MAEVFKKMKEAGVKFSDLDAADRQNLADLWSNMENNEKKEANVWFKEQHLKAVANGSYRHPDPTFEEENPEFWEEWDDDKDCLKRDPHQRFHHTSYYRDGERPEALKRIFRCNAGQKRKAGTGGNSIIMKKLRGRRTAAQKDENHLEEPKPKE